jgi:hypothetical protein
MKVIVCVDQSSHSLDAIAKAESLIKDKQNDELWLITGCVYH